VSIRASLVAVVLFAVLACPSAAQADATLSLSTTTLDFGTVPANATKQHKTVTVTNNSASPVTINEVELASPEAPYGYTEYVGFSPTVPPGASTDLVISADPSTVPLGTRLGRADISYTTEADPNTPVAAGSVDLSVVIGAPYEITSTSLTPASFYPLVRDGYRDHATYSFTLNQAANAVVTVFDGNDNQVREFDLGYVAAGTVKWGGYNDNGARVSVGQYRFQLTMWGNGATVRSDMATTQVRTGWKYTKRTKRRDGRYITGKSCAYNAATGCFSEPDGSRWWLQSVQAGTISVWYRFSIPAGAYNLSCGAYVSFHDGPRSIGCKRLSARYARVKVSVPTNATAVIATARVSFTTKVRI
jgi:hypothetical protein